jgi:hypothetical protein
LLAEIVVDVQGPLHALPEEFFGWHGGIESYNDVEFDDGIVSWYDDTDDDDDDDEDEDEDGDEDEDEEEDEMDYYDGLW